MGNVLQGVLPGDYRLLVAPGRISDAVGQRRENLRTFAQRGYRLTITDSCALTGREVRLYGTSATFGSARPITFSIYTLPIMPKQLSISAGHSTFAPESSSR